MPTWNAYNCLISKEKDPTIIQFLPLYTCPLTDWSNLYSALKQVQGIGTSITPNLKTKYLKYLTKPFTTVRVVFDRCKKESLKSRTGAKRTSEKLSDVN